MGQNGVTKVYGLGTKKRVSRHERSELRAARSGSDTLLIVLAVAAVALGSMLLIL